MTVMTLAQDEKTAQLIFRIARLMHERDPKAPPIKGAGNHEVRASLRSAYLRSATVLLLT